VSKIVVSVGLIDGGLVQSDEEPDVLLRLSTLERQGLRGKQLIHALLFTDHWRPPPTVIEICGKTPDVNLVEIRIPYSWAII
jgi:hypothetical protein